MAIERDIIHVNSPRTREQEQVDSNSGGSTVESFQLDPRPIEFESIPMSQEEIEGRKIIDEFMLLPERERKARRADVLDRGVLFDRLSVALPPDLHGEWARNDPLYIAHMRTLGFWVDDTYATRRALHSDGSSANIVGDVIFMVTTKANKELNDRVQQERSKRELRNPKLAPEERDAQTAVPEEIPVFSESKVHEVSANELRDAITRSSRQTSNQR